MSPLQRWLLALALTTAVVIIGFYWLDRPIAFWVHMHLGGSGGREFEPITHIPDPLVPAAVIAFFGLGLRALTGQPMSRFASAIVACSVSLTTAQAAKNLLKYVFGRTWPETWTHNNLSLIHDGAYGFHWFHAGTGYESFPSGHMAAICAVISVLWIYYPRLRPLWTLTALAVAASLIGANFHFFSDVVAGSFVGVSTGWITTVHLEQQWRVSGN